MFMIHRNGLWIPEACLIDRKPDTQYTQKALDFDNDSEIAITQCHYYNRLNVATPAMAVPGEESSVNKSQWQELHTQYACKNVHPVQVQVGVPGLKLPMWDIRKAEQVTGTLCSMAARAPLPYSPTPKYLDPYYVFTLGASRRYQGVPSAQVF